MKKKIKKILIIFNQKHDKLFYYLRLFFYINIICLDTRRLKLFDSKYGALVYLSTVGHAILSSSFTSSKSSLENIFDKNLSWKRLFESSTYSSSCSPVYFIW